MKCPLCGNKMVKQEDPRKNELDLSVMGYSYTHPNDKYTHDTIVEWYKCSDNKCLMAVYLSNYTRECSCDCGCGGCSS